MARPLLDVHCIRKPGCEYPVSLRVAMDDGTVQNYTLEVKTEIHFGKTFGELVTGYPKKRRRNRLHRLQP